MTARAFLPFCLVSLLASLSLLAAAEINADNSQEVGHRSKRMQWLQRVRTMPALLPRDLETLGISVSMDPGSREFTMRRWYHVLAVPAFFESKRASYQITWGVKMNNGAFLTLPFRDSDPCITEGSIKRDLGASYVHSRSGDRHFMPNQKPPPGLRPWRDTYVYELDNGLSLSFAFDDACASEMEIAQPMAPDWSPRASDLEGGGR